MLVHPKLRNPPMTASKRIVLSSDHAAIALRQAIAAHISAQGWEAVDIGPTTPQSTPSVFAEQSFGSWNFNKTFARVDTGLLSQVC